MESKTVTASREDREYIRSFSVNNLVHLWAGRVRRLLINMTSISKHGRVYRMAEPGALDQEHTSFDVIVLHGLGGSWNKTWTSRRRYCFLSNALASKFPSSRILSIEHPHLLRDLADPRVDVQGLILDLLHERSSRNRSDSPIVFIGHSFGGSLLKQIFLATHPSRTDQPDYHRLHGSLRAYVYLGTPQKHVSFPDISALWRALEFDCDSTTLGGGSTDLAHAVSNVTRINNDFRELGGEDLPSLCFYETVKTRVALAESYIVPQIDAVLGSRPVEAIPLDARHQALGKFAGLDDNNLLRFLAAFERLMTLAADPVVRRSDVAGSGAQQPGLKLLSLDGGGVKGLFSILVLKRLLDEVVRLEEHTTGEATGTTMRKRPCDYFDLIGGTSTGGLLAIMLGRLQMDTLACIRTYKSLSRTIFSRYTKIALFNPIFTAANLASSVAGIPLYSGDKLKAAVLETIEEHLQPSERANMIAGGHTVEDVRLAPIIADPTSCRCFVCAVPKGQHGSAERIRSYRSVNPSARNTSSYTIWEAARATSAAPTYFPAITVQDQTYFDGGLACNNPVVEVIKEARTEFPGSRIDVVVSIGTGSEKPLDPDGYLHDVLRSFVQRVTNTEARHLEVLRDEAFADLRAGYFRFQGDLTLGAIDLADADRLDEIELLANQFLESREGNLLIRTCAAKMARR